MSAASRRKEQDPGLMPDPLGWMLSFSDTLTNLLCFFVLMLTMSSMDAKKLKETFGFFDAAAGALDYSSHAAAESSSSEVKPVVSNALASDVAKAMRMHLAGSTDPLTAAQEALRPYSALSEVMVVAQHADGLHVDIAHTALFDERGALSTEGRTLLDALASLAGQAGLYLNATVWARREDAPAPLIKTAPDSWDRATALARQVLQVIGEPRQRLATLSLGLRGDGEDLGPTAEQQGDRVSLVLREKRGD